MDMVHIHPSLSSRKDIQLRPNAKIFTTSTSKYFCQKVCRIYTHIVEINNCQNKMTWTLSRRGAMSVAEMRRTRKSSYEMANTYFSWLKARSLVVRMVNCTQMGVQCCSLELLETPSASKKKMEETYSNLCLRCVLYLYE